MPTIQTSAKTVDTALAIEIRDAFCDEYGYQDTINGQPNPQSKASFAQERMDNNFVENVKDIVVNYRKRQVSINRNVVIN